MKAHMLSHVYTSTHSKAQENFSVCVGELLLSQGCVRHNEDKSTIAVTLCSGSCAISISGKRDNACKRARIFSGSLFRRPPRTPALPCSTLPSHTCQAAYV